MKITKEQIQTLNPCKDGYEWYLKHGTDGLLETLLSVNKVEPQWARWLFTRLMSLKQKRMIAIFSAELVLYLYEEKNPGKHAPRKAIEAAKAVIENDTPDNRALARTAYAVAAYAAAYAYAAYAAYAARKIIQEKIIHEAVRILDMGVV